MKHAFSTSKDIHESILYAPVRRMVGSLAHSVSFAIVSHSTRLDHQRIPPFLSGTENIIACFNLFIDDNDINIAKVGAKCVRGHGVVSACFKDQSEGSDGEEQVADEKQQTNETTE